MAYVRDAVGEIKRVNDELAVKLVLLALITMGVVQLGVPLVIAALSYWLFGGRIDAGTALGFLRRPRLSDRRARGSPRSAARWLDALKRHD